MDAERSAQLKRILEQDKVAGPRPIGIEKYRQRTKNIDQYKAAKPKRGGKRVLLTNQIKYLRELIQATTDKTKKSSLELEAAEKQKELNKLRRVGRNKQRFEDRKVKATTMKNHNAMDKH